MIISNRLFRIYVVFGTIIILLVLMFGYLFFEPYLTEETIKIEVINSAKFGDIPHRYFIFTPDEVFENSDSYYQDKHNADILFMKLVKGGTYKVKVVGIYMPWLPRFRNIIDIVDNEKEEVF